MRFSVIIPAYNAEKFIKRSIMSVLGQSYSDFEIIVVDDGSQDDTYSVAKEIQDNRLIVLNQNNSGVSVARNTGIMAATGDYICFLDADDEYLPEHLEQLHNLICCYPDKTFYCTKYRIGFLDGSVSQVNCSDSAIYYENAVDEVLKESELILTCCVCIRKDMFELYGLFEPGVRLGEDTDMWRRVYVHTGVVYLDKVTVKINRDGSEATKVYQRKHEADPLCRVPTFLSDPTIKDDVKESIKTELEYSKVEVVRTYLLEGKKRKAREEYAKIERKRISFEKKTVTDVCFLIPGFLLRYYIRKKNEKMYRW